MATNKKITPAAYKLATILGSHADADGNAWPDQITLTKETGLSTRGIRQNIKSLKSYGLLDVRWIRAGDPLPSGNIARRARPIYIVKFDPIELDESHSSGEQSSPEHSSLEHSSFPQGNRVPVLGEQSSASLHEKIMNRSVEERKSLSSTKKKIKPSKPTDPPGTLSERQKDIFTALQKALFYVSGRGDRTGWEAVSDPVGLAERLGGDGYLNVNDPPSLIHRLAAWTQANKNKAKKDIGRFLTNTFSREANQGTSGKQTDPSIEYDWL
ncbi:MAG: helix-turn-helix domain-containing protein [Proteobacteria bacterium]|nr:helix-turn-helix domain-containing protein [Pseudomonadota bacterium]